MGYFEKLAELGFMVVCRRNALNTTTMFAVRESDYESLSGRDDFDDFLLWLPEWRVVDFIGDDAGGGAKMLYEKLTCSGKYAEWDKRLGGYVKDADDNEVLIGFEHRPESERFQPLAEEA